QIARLIAFDRRNGASYDPHRARGSVLALDLAFDAQHVPAPHRHAVLLEDDGGLTLWEKIEVGSAKGFFYRLSARHGCRLIEEHVTTIILHVLDEHAKRQVVDEAVQQGLRVT